MQQAPINFTEFFKEERDIFVQNVSGTQVSLMFEVGAGRFQSHLFDTTNRPVNLTQYVPFAAIKNSMDFRKMIVRRPPILILMSEEQYTKYYNTMAVSEGLTTEVVDEQGNKVKVPDVAAALERAQEEQRKVLNHEPLPLDQTRNSTPSESEPLPTRNNQPIMAEDIINPRILHLCNQVKNEIPENERMPAAELITSLKQLHGLTVDDLEYVRAHGFYTSVRKWAKTQIEAQVTAAQDAQESTSAL